MNEKSRLQSSLSRLLRRKEEGTPLPESAAWFSSQPARRGRLELNRAGEEKYLSSLLDVRADEDGALTLNVDRLLPTPHDSFWHEPVSLLCTLTAFDAGPEEIATFQAVVGERIDHHGREAVELTRISDFERETREYVATPGPGHGVELSFVWYGSWLDVRAKRITVSRLFFDAELAEFTSADGYSITQAMLKLGAGTSGAPVRLHITRGRSGEYEAELEKIDGVAKQKLVAIIEEIWRTEAGLSSRRMERGRGEVGYLKRDASAIEEVTQPQIVLLGEDKRWEALLGELGRVIELADCEPEVVSDTVASNRCDLIVGDADRWGAKAVAVERLLRSVARYRSIPRVWFTSEPVGEAWEKSDVVLDTAGVDGERTRDGEQESDAEDAPLDHVDFGAFDLIGREMDGEQVLRRLRWALGANAFGRGEGVLLVTQDARALPYRARADRRVRLPVRRVRPRGGVAACAGKASPALDPARRGQLRGRARRDARENGGMDAAEPRSCDRARARRGP